MGFHGYYGTCMIVGYWEPLVSFSELWNMGGIANSSLYLDEFFNVIRKYKFFQATSLDLELLCLAPSASSRAPLWGQKGDSPFILPAPVSS